MSKLKDIQAAQINNRLMTDAKAVETALVFLLDRQTASEKSTQHTSAANGVGFSPFDAEIFTSFANQINRGRSLTDKQLAVCRRTKEGKDRCRLGKYWNQLSDCVELLAPIVAPHIEVAEGEISVSKYEDHEVGYTGFQDSTGAQVSVTIYKAGQLSLAL